MIAAFAAAALLLTAAPPTSDEAIAAFGRADRNGDMKLEGREFVRLPMGLRHLLVDADDDGAVSTEEFGQAIAKVCRDGVCAEIVDQAEDAMTAFRMADADGDLTITPRESLSFSRAFRTQLVDNNRDGAVSFEEYTAAGERQKSRIDLYYPPASPPARAIEAVAGR